MTLPLVATAAKARKTSHCSKATCFKAENSSVRGNPRAFLVVAWSVSADEGLLDHIVFGVGVGAFFKAKTFKDLFQVVVQTQ